MKKISLYLSFTLCLCFNLFGQSEKSISKKKLLKDVKQLEKFMDAHPDLNQHISEEDFKTAFKNVRASIDEPQSVIDSYRKLSALVALIKDGHSSVYFPREWLKRQRKKRGAFPLEVHLTNDDQLFVIKKFNNCPIPLGSKIVSINGMTVDSFLNVIDPYISYEIKPFRNTIISRSFEQYLYVAFDYFDEIILEYSSLEKTGSNNSITVKNMDYKEWKKFQKNNKEERERRIKEGKPYSYKNLGKGIGLLNIYAFVANDLDFYNIFLKKTFKSIRQDSIHSLIIDIRGNFGGWPKISSNLFHYISNGHFKTMAKSSLKVSEPYRDIFYDAYPELRRTKGYNYRFPERRHYVNIEAIIKDPLDSYVNEDLFFNEPPINLKYEFKGDCYLLTNRDSYSAASSFASTFQCYQMGTIIGEETGGTKIFRANAIGKTLKSKLRVNMSTTKLYTACYDGEFKGVMPDIEFKPFISNIISETDAQLLYTQGVIIKKQRDKAKALEKKRLEALEEEKVKKG